jgi:hypothetical protein
MTSAEAGRWSTRETIAGFLATFAIFAGAFELFYRPFRLAPVSLILLLIATVMSRQESQQKLIRIGVATVGICFIVGATIQILTQHPLY